MLPSIRSGFTLLALLLGAFFPVEINCQPASKPLFTIPPVRVLLYAGVGWNPVSWPNGTDSVTGFDPAIASAICERLNRTCEWVLTTNTTDRSTYLIDGKADITVAAFSVTPERSQTVDFVRPYYYSAGSTLFAPNGTVNTADGWKGVAGKTACVWEGNLGSTLAPTVGMNTYQVTGANLTQAILDGVAAGNCIGAIGDNYASISYGMPSTNLPTLEELPYGIAVAKNNIELSNQVSAALVSMMSNGADSQMLQLEKEWMIDNGSPPNYNLAKQVDEISNFVVDSSSNGSVPSLPPSSDAGGALHIPLTSVVGALFAILLTLVLV